MFLRSSLLGSGQALVLVGTGKLDKELEELEQVEELEEQEYLECQGCLEFRVHLEDLFLRQCQECQVCLVCLEFLVHHLYKSKCRAHHPFRYDRDVHPIREDLKKNEWNAMFLFLKFI